jgi:hypothetical protein
MLYIRELKPSLNTQSTRYVLSFLLRINLLILFVVFVLCVNSKTVFNILVFLSCIAHLVKFCMLAQLFAYVHDTNTRTIITTE